MGLFSGKKNASGAQPDTPASVPDAAAPPPRPELMTAAAGASAPPPPKATPTASGEMDSASSTSSLTMVPPKKTVAQVLGEVTWLLTQSPVHKQLFIGDLEWFMMPPLLLEQFRVFHGKQHPVGVALWARVSQETDQRLRSGAFKLRPDEWKGGNIPWLIELVGPFGGTDEMMADLSAAIFPTETFNYHNINNAGQRVIDTYAPKPKS